MHDLIANTAAQQFDLLKLVGSAFVAMGTVISVLWARHLSSHKESLRRAEDCEKKHVETTVKQIEMAGQIGELRGRQDGIEQLSRQVLRVVEANTHHDEGQ